MMWQYQYLRERITDDNWVERCNDLGKSGWSLHSMRWADDGSEAMCFFKRTLTEKDIPWTGGFYHDRHGTPEDREAKRRESEEVVRRLMVPRQAELAAAQPDTGGQFDAE